MSLQQLRPSTQFGPGSVIQVVYATQPMGGVVSTANIPHDNTIPQNSEGAQFASLTITPRYSTSVLMVSATVPVTNLVNGSQIVTLALFRDAIVDSLAATWFESASATTGTPYNTTGHINLNIVSGGVSATTFYLRVGGTASNSNNYNTAMMGGVAGASFSIVEVAA